MECLFSFYNVNMILNFLFVLLKAIFDKLGNKNPIVSKCVGLICVLISYPDWIKSLHQLTLVF